MQQDNNIENKLQQIEMQQLPDLSHMDAHWDQMAAMLADENRPAPAPVSSNRKLLLLLVAIAALFLVMVGIRGFFGSGDNGNKNISINKNDKPASSNIIIADTTPGKMVPATLPASANATVKPVTKKYFYSYPDYNPPPKVNINFYPCDSNEALSKNSLDDSLKLAYEQQLQEQANIQLLQQFLVQVEKSAQLFIIDNRRDTSLNCEEGTVITIPASVFSNPADAITIEVKEYYSYADMVSNKLNTSSNGKQLISDGMLSIKAMQGGKEIKMNGIKPMNIKMPRRDDSEGMQLFTGEWKPVVPANNLSSNISKLNWIPKGQFQLYGIRCGNRQERLEPYRVKRRWFTNKEVKKYALAGSGYDNLSFDEAREMIREDNPDEDFIIKLKSKRPHPFLAFMGKMKWVRLFDNGNVNGQMMAIVSQTDTKADHRQLKKTVNLMRKYEFNVSNTGWINCDRFMDDPAPKVDFTINSNDSTRIYVSYLVFNKIRSVLTGFGYDNNAIGFNDIPEGRDVTLVSLGIKKGKAVCGIKQMTTVKGKISDLQFETIDPDSFKKRVAELDL